MGIDAVAGANGRDAVADGFDDAAGIGAGSIRKLPGAVLASADVGFDGINADGVNADNDLAGAGLWVGDFFKFQDVGIAELVDADGFHEMAPWLDHTAWACRWSIPISHGSWLRASRD